MLWREGRSPPPPVRPRPDTVTAEYPFGLFYSASNRVEATDVLRRLERARRISTPEANAAHEDLMQLDLQLLSFEPFADRIWELRHTITSHDAWYVAVAEALALPFATLDERLAKAQGPKCTFLTTGRAPMK
ncbi:MAG TPA: type II toxin-antitoxin system VapC family toxin [Steroidobacteraceae bacterium]|nr:type II toxin-antitoxin system VapC family toxin [Steroidobacteraceae bacterium]